MDAAGLTRPRRRPKPAPASKPWHSPPIGTAAGGEDADIFAIKAVACGNANAAQQVRAFNFILHKLCEVDRMTFWPDSVRATDFAEGKRWVGVSLRRILGLRDGDFKSEAREPAALPSAQFETQVNNDQLAR